MGGLFGGILGLVSAIGGGVLYLLVGGAAWKTNNAARNFRLLLGGLALGLLIGLALPLVIGGRNVPGDTVPAITVGTLVAVFILEWMRRALDGDD